MRWSPEQISGWLCEQGIKLSHECIYQMIWQDKRDGGDLWRCLRRRGKRYNKRAGKNAGRGVIPNRIGLQSLDPRRQCGDHVSHRAVTTWCPGGHRFVRDFFKIDRN
jgi:IS30 family transposase